MSHPPSIRMQRSISALLAGLLIAVSATACRKSSMTRTATLATASDTLVPGTFITASGTFTHTKGTTTRSLEVTLAGSSLSLSHGRSENFPSGGSSASSSASRVPILSPADPWFIYVESPGRIWCFDGRAELSTFDPDGGDSGPVLSSGKVHPSRSNIPPDVTLRLPDDLRKLLPPVKPPVKRPSL